MAKKLTRQQKVLMNSDLKRILNYDMVAIRAHQAKEVYLVAGFLRRYVRISKKEAIFLTSTYSDCFDRGWWCAKRKMLILDDAATRVP